MGGAFAYYGYGGYGDSTDGEDGVPVSDPAGDFTESTLLFAALDPYQFSLPGYQGVLMLFPSGTIGPIALPPPGNQQLPFKAPLAPGRPRRAAGLRAARLRRPRRVPRDGPGAHHSGSSF
jgi:hypothetical protein